MHIATHGLIATGMANAPPAALSRPSTIAAALGDLTEPGAVAVAGGTDLCAQYNEGLAPRLLVALDGLAELAALEIDATEIRIGALVTHTAGSAHAGLRAALPGFTEAWRLLANPRVRFTATIGGNLMARRTRYEMSLLLTALGATLRFAAPAGLSDATPQEVWGTSPALLHHIAIPRRAGGRFHYMRGLRPQLTLAVYRHDAGGAAAIATEWLRPVPLALDDTGLEALPEAFHDPVISHWYARRAGAVLLRRGLEALDAR